MLKPLTAYTFEINNYVHVLLNLDLRWKWKYLQYYNKKVKKIIHIFCMGKNSTSDKAMN